MEKNSFQKKFDYFFRNIIFVKPTLTQDASRALRSDVAALRFRDFHEFQAISAFSRTFPRPSWGAESAISALVPFCLGTLPSAPDSRGDISALRRSWKVFLGSKFAYASSTTRKTKQLMVLATSEKVIQKCRKNHHSAKPPLASLRGSSVGYAISDTV